MINYIEKGQWLHKAIADYRSESDPLFRLFLHQEDGVWVSNNDEIAQQIIDNFNPLPYARAEAKKRVVAQAENALKYIEDAYPSFEKQTWPFQRDEVLAYQRDNSAPTPTLDAIAASAQISRETAIQAAATKVIAFSNLANAYVGIRKKLFTQIETETDWRVIQNINFEGI